ncbi:MAG TPA: GrpB family protein [Streptosporangiaceae bacterium]|nr:GrpB family protein [Streptosporangiaceae bacterium]HUZ38556.1 GrpB family protein [Streptosporangiaceae bacterium]
MPDQLVEIVEYDLAWPGEFAGQRDTVTAVLGPWLAGPVEHIGSTSVPGLPAKPVIDMLAPVGSLRAAHYAVGALEADGWLFWPDDPCRYYRLWFLRPRPEARTHHLHVIECDHPHAQALLAFRDALRADPGLCRDYAQMKRDLARQHGDNRNAYSNAKGGFVERVLRGAGIEPPLRDLLPE